MEKAEKLRNILNTCSQEGLAVAFSGGIDSSLLLALACKTRNAVPAVMLYSQLMPLRDREIAERVAAECGAELTVLPVDITGCPEVMGNTRRRCHYCKKTMFGQLRNWCDARGVPHILDGTNADDLGVYRPGLQALRELGIRSPLAECGITKAEVRKMAEELGLSVASRPSTPCMATRLPYDTPLDFAVLRRLETGEQLLREAGFPVCRLRLHGSILRIEIPKSDFPRFLEEKEKLTAGLKALQFDYITLDLEGFRSGSMDTGVNNHG